MMNDNNKVGIEIHEEILKLIERAKSQGLSYTEEFLSLAAASVLRETLDLDPKVATSSNNAVSFH